MCEAVGRAIELIQPKGEIGADLYRARQECFAEVRVIVSALLDKYCRERGKARWCQKSPNDMNRLNWLNAVFPDAQYLCLHRNGHDTVRSILDTLIWMQPGAARDSEAKSRRAAQVVERWCKVTELLLAFEQVKGATALRVRYEDLVRDPGPTIRRILTFLCLEEVPNLHELVFLKDHDDGPGDSKIAGSRAVESGRIGGELNFDARHLPASLRRRMSVLLKVLGY
jgi:protein-tyrosine sulfotransferase